MEEVIKNGKLLQTQSLLKQVEEGYINVTQHPTAPLLLWNYSKTAQIYGHWTPETCVCRGLVTDLDYNVVARPFQKFWNYEEYSDKTKIPGPTEVSEISDKLDGSLGIMYWIGDTPYITTRGNFESHQGAHATEILQRRYSEVFESIKRDWTFLFEIIWPAGDPHCIKYPGIDDIFLLAVIDIATGQDIPRSQWPPLFRTTTVYPGITDYLRIREEIPGDNREGFVVRFKSGLRIKLKYPGYLKMHYLKSYLTPKVIFGYISGGRETELMDTLKDLDFEQTEVAREVIAGFYSRFQDIEAEAQGVVSHVRGLGLITPQEVAAEILKSRLSGIVFRAYRGQDYRESIWGYMKKEL